LNYLHRKSISTDSSSLIVGKKAGSLDGAEVSGQAQKIIQFATAASDISQTRFCAKIDAAFVLEGQLETVMMSSKAEARVSIRGSGALLEGLSVIGIDTDEAASIVITDQKRKMRCF